MQPLRKFILAAPEVIFPWHWDSSNIFQQVLAKSDSVLGLSRKRLLLLLLTACPHEPGIDAAESIAYIYHGHKTTLKVQS